MEFILSKGGIFLREFWQVLGEMAPYLLFGFLVAGVLKVLVPVSFVERHLGGRGMWQSIKAAFIGVPLPLCSCSVIPVSASLRRSGAGKGATASFLLSAPQTGVDSIAVTYSLLGPLFAVYRVVVAMLSGVIGGWLVDVGTRRESEADSHVDDCECSSCKTEEQLDHSHSDACGDSHCDCGDDSILAHVDSRSSWGRKIVTMLRYGFVTLPRDIGGALLIGLVLAGILGAVVPEHFFQQYIGGGVWPMVLMIVIGVPLYICATASVPVAAALIIAGISPGAALVFLICGPATNAATITTIWKFLGRTATMIYLAVVVVSSLLAGLMLDLLYTHTSATKIMHQHELLPAWFASVSAIALLLVIVHAYWPRRVKQVLVSDSVSQTIPVDSAVLDVNGMTCEGCSASVERVLSEQPGVKTVQVDLVSGKATVLGEGLDAQLLVQAVCRLGFTATVN